MPSPLIAAISSSSYQGAEFTMASCAAGAMAARTQGRVLVDGFAGCGGNVVAMARMCSHAHRVIAIDTHPMRLKACLHNAAIYGVEHKVQAVHSDFFAVAPHLQVSSCWLINHICFDISKWSRPTCGHIAIGCST